MQYRTLRFPNPFKQNSDHLIGPKFSRSKSLIVIVVVWAKDWPDITWDKIVSIVLGGNYRLQEAVSTVWNRR